MKIYLLFLVALFSSLTLLFSCSHKENAALLPELVQAESLMYYLPDSSLRILELMPMPKASNHLQHATWCMLITQARYRSYIDDTSDLLINIAYNYLMAQDNPQRKALVFLKGALNEIWYEAEKATDFYLNPDDFYWFNPDQVLLDYALVETMNLNI